MNLGYFSELYRPDVNGTVTSMTTFAQELERVGHSVDVFAPAPMLVGRLGSARHDGGVHRFHSMEYPFYPGFRLSFPLYSPVRSELERLSLDVVHSHTPFSLGIFAERVARKNRIPHVHSYHTRWPQYARHYFPGPPDLAERSVERCLTTFCNVTDYVIAPSAATRCRLIEHGVRTPIEIVPTPVAPDAFGVADCDGATRRRFGIPADAPLVLTVGRLGAEKSVDFLLRGFARLLLTEPDARFLIVGDGPLRGSLDALAEELGIRDRIVFAGEIAIRADVLQTYAAADVFVCASRTETQCLTMLEAAAAGCPLVARRDPPLAELLEPGVNGAFVAHETDFADAVAALLAAPSEARSYGDASVRIAHRYDVHRRTEQLIGIYARARERMDSDAAVGSVRRPDGRSGRARFRRAAAREGAGTRG